MLDTARHTFDLWTEDWIPVNDGKASRLVSLDDFFRNAHTYAYLEGEVPTMPFAVRRILSTILRQAVEPEEGADPLETWTRVYSEGRFPMEEIEAYREQWADRFDLFHPERPFMQAPGLETARNDYLPPAALLSTVPNGEKHFSSRFGAAAARMAPSEAALWLIHTMAFDVSGIKPAAVDDPRGKGGRGYPIGTGWAGRLGGFQIIGKNLFETVMLNTRFQADDDEDKALWERDEVLTGAPSREEGAAPVGDSDLYTWPSRRIRLRVAADGAVDGVLITNGDRLAPYGKEKLEPASFWRNSEAQAKVLKVPGPVFMPKSHDPSRAAWQRIDSILANPGTDPIKGQERVPQAKLLEQAIALVHADVLPPKKPLLIETVGLAYGTQDAIITDMYSDRVSFESQLLLPENAAAQTAVVDLARLTTFMIKQVGYRMKDAREAAGASGVEASATVEKALYFSVDPLFREWLQGLDLAVLDQEITRWKKTLFTLLIRAAEAEILKLGPRAFVGRVNPETGKETSALDALNHLSSILHKNLLSTTAHTKGDAA